MLVPGALYKTLLRKPCFSKNGNISPSHIDFLPIQWSVVVFILKRRVVSSISTLPAVVLVSSGLCPSNHSAGACSGDGGHG